MTASNAIISLHLTVSNHLPKYFTDRKFRVSHIQAALATILKPVLTKNLLVWLDDILLYENNTSRLLYTIEAFLDICIKHNFKLHPTKCILFENSVRWCGRIVSAKLIHFDLTKLQGLIDMSVQTTGAHLQQFVCTMQWVRTAIPNFANLIS